MTNSTLPADFVDRLTSIRQLCPELRFGQLVATIAMLAEDETSRNLWDVEDSDFAAAMERFAADLARRKQDPIATVAAASEQND